ncbi:hypothetical protein CBL_20035 [Carabus blaptoides fortunei]
MRDYLGRITELHRKLSSSGYGFTVKELALVMLMGLPEAYEPLILNLEQDENSLSTKKVKARLLIEEKRKVRREEERLSDNEGDSSKALYSRNQRGNFKLHKQAKDDKKPNTNKSWKEDRSESMSQKDNDVSRRRICCYGCGKFGHIAKNCPEREDGASHQVESNQRKDAKAKKMVHSALFSKTKSNTDEPALNSGTWYLDSGADDHMTSRRDKLTNFKKNNSRVEVANKEMIEVTGTGTAEF